MQNGTCSYCCVLVHWTEFSRNGVNNSAFYNVTSGISRGVVRSPP